jgi:CHAT domain-containing protein
MSKTTLGFARYAAFSLTADKMNSLRMIDLGPAAPIDSLILACRSEMKENISKLGPRPRKEAEEYLASNSHQLYQRLFAPLKAALPDSGMLYCAPDGTLHLLPFEILVDENGKYLVERYQFNYLGSGRDLLRFEKNPARGRMYIFADADFDGKPSTQVAAQQPLLAASDLFLPSENVRRSKDWRGIKFDPLDSTAVEARAIQKLFRANENEVFLAHRATEQNLLSLQSP